ncbi:T9SS type A sorting domain-containing protein [Chitinophaga pinensis]|uniref:T9SS type A sorting domain-containing protein n=1 Tax=Chitinophaga pinensis TaxID=79329 RepID=A0A5C6LNW3_9BACT|nr:T9SS type A sorting domain-containing protein [Chitinophaga pinensis]TWV99174.1 T9SS type A sorting domain-containing protein [Chitinophaga pinensis]
MAFSGSVACTALAAAHTAVGALKDVVVYPNPVRGQLNISMRNFDTDEDVLISLYNSAGIVVVNRRIKATPNFTLDAVAEKLQPGVYILKVSGKKEFVRKIVISR